MIDFIFEYQLHLFSATAVAATLSYIFYYGTDPVGK